MPDLSKLDINQEEGLLVILVEGVPTLIPLIFAVLTPIAFCCLGLMMKHLTQPRIGFDPCVLSLTSLLIVGFVIFSTGIYSWLKIQVNLKMVGIGLLSGISDIIAITLILTSISNGLGGPACALFSL